MKNLIILITFFIIQQNFAQEVVRIPVGIISEPQTGQVKLELIHRKQMYNVHSDGIKDVYDAFVHSPKSVVFNNNIGKLYINALEGFVTIVYDDSCFKFIKRINHRFQSHDSSLFNNENTVFDYRYAYRKNNFNIFSGKPVESCFSHNKKYLWVSSNF